MHASGGERDGAGRLIRRVEAGVCSGGRVRGLDYLYMQGERDRKGGRPSSNGRPLLGVGRACEWRPLVGVTVGVLVNVGRVLGQRRRGERMGRRRCRALKEDWAGRSIPRRLALVLGSSRVGAAAGVSETNEGRLARQTGVRAKVGWSEGGRARPGRKHGGDRPPNHPCFSLADGLRPQSVSDTFVSAFVNNMQARTGLG